MCLSKQRRSGSREKLLLITGVRNAPVISQHKLFRLCINSTASGEPVVNNGEIPVTCMVQIKYGSTSKFLNLFDSLSCPLCLFNGWSGFLELWTLKYYQRASYVLGVQDFEIPVSVHKMLRHIKISQSAKWLNPELGNSFCTVFQKWTITDIQESKCARGALFWK